ncbi:unnamed protein product, partial [Owenia fusiformis]
NSLSISIKFSNNDSNSIGIDYVAIPKYFKSFKYFYKGPQCMHYYSTLNHNTVRGVITSPNLLTYKGISVDVAKLPGHSLTMTVKLWKDCGCCHLVISSDCNIKETISNAGVTSITPIPANSTCNQLKIQSNVTCAKGMYPIFFLMNVYVVWYQYPMESIKPGIIYNNVLLNLLCGSLRELMELINDNVIMDNDIVLQVIGWLNSCSPTAPRHSYKEPLEWGSVAPMSLTNLIVVCLNVWPRRKVKLQSLTRVASICLLFYDSDALSYITIVEEYRHFVFYFISLAIVWFRKKIGF